MPQDKVHTIPKSEDFRVPSNSETLIDKPGFIGLVLDRRYLIERELGKGGVGAVYLAHDRKLHDKRVVVKVLLEHSLQNPWVVQKFKQEMEALARVDHPGVVGILDTGELLDHKPYLVMQYVDGVPLREAIKSEPDGMDLERAASIIKQSGTALGAVHQKKIYHRDLKPENIMLQTLGHGEEQVKIVDFGVARVKESTIAPSTVTGAATPGTIVYMSPEQLRGEKVTAASDIYSLAVIAYEMVTGRRPFHPDTIAHLAEMQRQGVRARPADLRPRLPEEAQAVILRALAFDPKERHQDAAEFGGDLAQALMNEEVTLKLRQIEKTDMQPGQYSEQATPHSPRPRQLAATLLTPSTRVVNPKPLWPRLVAGLALAIALAAGAYFVISKQLNNSASPVVHRSFVYSLLVQKMRDGRPYEQAFQSSGQEIFETGYKFRLSVSSPQSGYLYVFNEGAAENGAASLTIIYPTPVTNNGSAKLEANQTIQSNWNTFAGQPGTEEFWIVWSVAPVDQLEAARDAAFKNNEGAITDAVMVRAMRDFFTKHSKPDTIKNTTRQQTEVHSGSEPVVKLVELEHR